MSSEVRLLRLQELFGTLDTLLDHIAAVCIEREQLRIGDHSHLSRLQELDWDLSRLLRLLCKEEHLFDRSISSSLVHSGVKFKDLNGATHPKAALLQNHLHLFEQVMPQILPLLEQLIQLLEEQTRAFSPEHILEVEEQISDCCKRLSAVHNHHPSIFVSLTKTPELSLEPFAEQPTSLWIIIKIFAPMLVFLTVTEELVSLK
jgi:hypothetical protein